MNLANLPKLGEAVPARRIYKIIEKISIRNPEFLELAIRITEALYNGHICYRKPHSLNNIRLRLSDLINHLIPAGLQLDLSNLFEATEIAIMRCSRDQYAVRKSILNTSKCIIKPLRGQCPIVDKISNELSKINIARTKDPEQPIVRIEDVNKAIDRVLEFRIKQYNKSLYSMILKTLVFSGLRISELIDLKVSDIDFERDRIFIEISKNGKSRWIGINHELKPTLKDYIVNKRSKTQSNKVFVLEDGRPITLDRIQKIFKQLRKCTKLNNLKPHSLRRLFCTHYAGKGVPLPHLQMALGHSSIAMVMRYCKPDREEVLRQQVNW